MPKTAAELKLERLTAKRENLFRRVQRCFDVGQSLKDDRQNVTKLEDFNIRYMTLSKTMLDYRQIVQQIVEVKQELNPDEPPNYGILDAFEDLCDHVEYFSKQFMNPNFLRNSSNSDTPKLKMPNIQLVKFNGEDLTLWPLFCENFKHLVHVKPEYSDAEKLHFLLGSLEGKALKTCNAIEAIPDNYEIIWKLLQDTYHDKKFLLNLYLNRLLNFRSLNINNPGNLQTFLEKFDTNVNALKRLQLENLDDHILTHIAMLKLPQEIVNYFELVRSNDNLPKYDELIKFIRQQSKVMVKHDKMRPVQQSSNYSNALKNTNSKTFLTNEGGRKCLACQKDAHLLKDCKFFKDSPHEQKFKLVKENNLCINCFSNKHKVSLCPSKFSCIKCKAKHHTLLHKNDQINRNIDIKPTTSGNQSINNNPEYNIPSTSQSDVVHTLCTKINNNEINKPQIVLLSTALVKVSDKWNNKQNLRFLIDSGSMSNLLTFDCCKKLGLPYSKISSNIVGIGDTIEPLKGRTSLIIQSNFDSNIKYPIEVLLVDKVTNSLPEVPIDTKLLNHLNGLLLADPTFHMPGVIDGILGASLFTQIIGSHRVTGAVGTPAAIQTTLGYIIIGPAPPLRVRFSEQSYCSFLNLESLVEKMWELEDFTPPVPTSEDSICENVFIENVSRNSFGRYTVALPFKDDPTHLGDSFALSQTRLFSLEKRLEKNLELRNTYCSIIQDYLDQGHMSLVPKSEINVLPCYYIPHHCIFKQSISTPCRIVFDASLKTDSGLSLNDILYTGPKLQNNVVTILLNFRLFPIAMVSDVKQMYRQINIVEAHRQYQRILWRFDTSDPISIYQLNTVTFGVKSSPYLSLRTIKQLAEDEYSQYPQAVTYVHRDLYMDDLICSLPDIKTGITIHTQLVKLFKNGGFQMVKWMSNSSELLSQIPDLLQLNQPITFDKENLKVLGLEWNPSSDNFSFKISAPILSCTKRNMLSLVARIFDPLGFLAPITLFVKLLIKKLWELKFDWDKEAPKEIVHLWMKFQDELKLLNNLQIPRHLLVFENSSIDIIGFADASSNAYASLIYIRSTDITGHVSVNFLCAQSKVAPMSKVTLPRLELCAAVQLSKLISHVRDTYSPRKDINQIFALSDSMITLNWIHSSPKRWKNFISNRVAKIQNCLPSSHWYFVAGKQNASDCASRGLSPASLMNQPSWFSGPEWLLLNSSQWPVKSFSGNEFTIPEEESLVYLVVKPIISPLYILIEYFSSWTKLLHCTIYVLRFIKILPRNNKVCKFDLDQAEYALVRAVQQRHFPEEYKLLLENKPVKSHFLRKLNPFMKDRIIRVGGRLSNANIAFDHKHPILLPKSDPFVNLLIDYNHKKYCHTGAHLLQSLLQQNYWILAARSIIRQRIWKCNHCFRLNPKPNYPIMSDLPSPRVNQAKAFLTTGVDFTGAFFITLGRRRGIKSQKAYVCLFICLTTKAVHLELASSLSTDSFLAAFKRFISRRGNCTTLFSDQGTNFIGGKARLDEVYQLTQSQQYIDALSRELNHNKINWKFNPPSAPHFGGIWEANIKSVKSHLSRVIGNQILNYEEFSTVLTQIEALLNSRPLCPLSSDPMDPIALTPAHFLYGSPLNSIPAEDLSTESPNRLNRYKLLDSMVQHYWKRWHIEYLSTLQARQKWNTPANAAQIGMVVVIIQDNIPPLQWPLAIIEKLYPGKDGVSRVAVVRTKNSSYTRPVAKLCPLPNQS